MDALRSILIGIAVTAFVGACSKPADDPSAETAAADATAAATAGEGEAPDWTTFELPIRKIPNIPESAEAYYGPDSLHVIAQTQDPKARAAQDEQLPAALTWIYKDDGSELGSRRKGQDACSYFFRTASGSSGPPPATTCTCRWATGPTTRISAGRRAVHLRPEGRHSSG